MRPSGFYPEIPEAEYHADQETLSHSGAKQLMRAPALFHYQREHPVFKDVFDFGSAAHALVLGKGMESVYVSPCDEFRTTAAKAERAEARRVGLSVITHADWLVVCDMASSLADHPFATSLLAGGDAEVSAYAPDEETGVMRRCRFDYIRQGDVASDYKTTASAAPDVFVKSCINYGYDSQAAWYSDMAADLGSPLTAFAFIAQEKTPPYLVEVYELPPELLARGRRRNHQALERFRDCTETDLWPGYTGQPFTTLTAPYWALREDTT